MASRVTAYQAPQKPGRIRQILKSITYREPYSDDSFEWNGQRFDNYDDLTARVAQVVMGEPCTLPDDEMPTPDFMPGVD